MVDETMSAAAPMHTALKDMRRMVGLQKAMAADCIGLPPSF